MWQTQEDSQLPVWAPVATPVTSRFLTPWMKAPLKLSYVKLTAGLPRPAPLADGRRPALWFWKGIKRLLEPTAQPDASVPSPAFAERLLCAGPALGLNIGWGQGQSCPQSGRGRRPCYPVMKLSRAVGRQLGGVTNCDPDLGLEWELLDNPGSLGIWRPSSLHRGADQAQIGRDSPDVLDPGSQNLSPVPRIAWPWGLQDNPGEDASPLPHS